MSNKKSNAHGGQRIRNHTKNDCSRRVKNGVLAYDTDTQRTRVCEKTHKQWWLATAALPADLTEGRQNWTTQRSRFRNLCGGTEQAWRKESRPSGASSGYFFKCLLKGERMSGFGVPHWRPTSLARFVPFLNRLNIASHPSNPDVAAFAWRLRHPPSLPRDRLTAVRSRLFCGYMAIKTWLSVAHTTEKAEQELRYFSEELEKWITSQMKDEIYCISTPDRSRKIRLRTSNTYKHLSYKAFLTCIFMN